VFPSTHQALQAERIAREAGVTFRMIPVPRELSSGCSMGMEASLDQKEFIQALLAVEKVECEVHAWRGDE